MRGVPRVIHRLLIMNFLITAPVDSEFLPGTVIKAAKVDADTYEMTVEGEIFDRYYPEDLFDLIRDFCSPIL